MWWKAWSGKWTVSKLLAKELGYEIISIGDMKRKLAAEMWINIIEFNKMWDDPEKSAEFDLKYEEYQKSLKLTDNIILDSRLWFYAQPKAFKILLKTYKWKHQIAETPEEKKALRKSKAKTKLLKDIALLLALILITCWRLFTIMNERKKAEIRENSELNENNEIEEVIEELE